VKTISILLFIAFSATLSAQPFRLSGLVKSSDGEPIAGAKVFLKKKNIGALTDGDGKFTIAFPEADSLVILAALFQPLVVFISQNDDRLFKTFTLTPREFAASEMLVRERKQNEFGIGKLESVQGTAIYEGKKLSLIHI
jgi:Fe(3+) dicitrate transport protein